MILCKDKVEARWALRPSPKYVSASGEIATFRGIGLSTRNGAYVGTVAELEVNRRDWRLSDGVRGGNNRGFKACKQRSAAGKTEVSDSRVMHRASGRQVPSPRRDRKSL
jgi:hypothetical protein